MILSAISRDYPVNLLHKMFLCHLQVYAEEKLLKILWCKIVLNFLSKKIFMPNCVLPYLKHKIRSIILNHPVLQYRKRLISEHFAGAVIWWRVSTAPRCSFQSVVLFFFVGSRSISWQDWILLQTDPCTWAWDSMGGLWCATLFSRTCGDRRREVAYSPSTLDRNSRWWF